MEPYDNSPYQAAIDQLEARIKEKRGWPDAQPVGNQMEAVNYCKLQFANILEQLHNHLEDLEEYDDEGRRLAWQAITETQTAQMWAVKALTWK